MPQTETLTPIEEKVLAADNLPSMPVVAIKVLELTKDPDVSVCIVDKARAIAVLKKLRDRRLRARKRKAAR